MELALRGERNADLATASLAQAFSVGSGETLGIKRMIMILSVYAEKSASIGAEYHRQPNSGMCVRTVDTGRQSRSVAISPTARCDLNDKFSLRAAYSMP